MVCFDCRFNYSCLHFSSFYFQLTIPDPASNDDYVAQILANDARDSSLKYSTLGMEAYLPQRYVTSLDCPNN
jgi:hypothetical protein